MCIYCGTTKYRKIYEKHYGIIPKETDGRSYEIHHIDGNHSNNSPENLTAVTLQEHYDIHKRQGDHGACFLLSQKLRLTPREISEHSREINRKRVDAGTHNFIKLRKPDHLLSRPRRKEKPVYRLKNLKTGEIVEMKINDFIKRYNLSASQGNISQMINGKLQTAKNWTIWFL
jgi:hypothetical protein